MTQAPHQGGACQAHAYDPAQLDRVLMAKGNVTIDTLQRAAALVGRELRLELI